LPKVIFAVYIHVHYSIYVIYLWILKLYHARPCAHARLCMLFLNGKIIVGVETERDNVQGLKFNLNPEHRVLLYDVLNLALERVRTSAVSVSTIRVPKGDHEIVIRDQ
jgi:hypothetical protein